MYSSAISIFYALINDTPHPPTPVQVGVIDGDLTMISPRGHGILTKIIPRVQGQLTSRTGFKLITCAKRMGGVY